MHPLQKLLDKIVDSPPEFDSTVDENFVELVSQESSSPAGPTEKWCPMVRFATAYDRQVCTNRAADMSSRHVNCLSDGCAVWVVDDGDFEGHCGLIRRKQ